MSNLTSMHPPCSRACLDKLRIKGRPPMDSGATREPAAGGVADEGAEAGSPVVVIGAGPVGLATAAHLAERGLDFVVLEAGPRVGAAITEWGHVRLFSSCGTVPPHGERELAHPETGFYLAGMKSYGRAPTFLLATGYEQVRSIVAAIAGDRESADTVQLDLPETGVCSAGPPSEDQAAEDQSAAASCCGAAPQPEIIALGAPAGLGFATGRAHGHSADAPVPPPTPAADRS
ncbi:MAG: FAD-dependent oxidoreductase [Streptosporangiales bacterium]|nr:FAD-dependent oxidoreductase [Streptosporangiales bacterium]